MIVSSDCGRIQAVFAAATQHMPRMETVVETQVYLAAVARVGLTEGEMIARENMRVQIDSRWAG